MITVQFARIYEKMHACMSHYPKRFAVECDAYCFMNICVGEKSFCRI